MTANQSPAVDHLASYSINRGRFRYDLPEPERDDPDQMGLPLPGGVTGYAVKRKKANTR